VRRFCVSTKSSARSPSTSSSQRYGSSSGAARVGRASMGIGQTPGHSLARPFVCDLTHESVSNSIPTSGRPDVKRRLYPAVLERGSRNALGAWFPDFPGCVAGGRSQEEAIERAERALAQAVDGWAEQGRPLPEPTPIERIVLPKGSDVVAYFIVGVDP